MISRTDPERLRQTRAFQQTLGIWVDRFRKAQAEIRRLETEVDRRDEIIAVLAAELPEPAVERIMAELESGGQPGAGRPDQGPPAGQCCDEGGHSGH